MITNPLDFCEPTGGSCIHCGVEDAPEGQQLCLGCEQAVEAAADEESS